MIRLRSVELELPQAAAAADFMVDHWGLAAAERRTGAFYLRGSGDFYYLLALFESPVRKARSITFSCSHDELACLERRVRAHGHACQAVTSTDPGGGAGLQLLLPEGEVFRFLAGDQGAAPLAGEDAPRQLTHVVLNASDAEASARFTEEILGFRVSDRTRAMVFVRCNRTHHSIAFARAASASLNHIAFQMQDIDAVMRGIGRMRDIGLQAAWGPGRHGPGNNVFAYFIAPFGAVIEYSTATEEVPEDHHAGSPEDWVWPPNRIDQWGVSVKDVAALAEAEKRFRFEGPR